MRKIVRKFEEGNINESLLYRKEAKITINFTV